MPLAEIYKTNPFVLSFELFPPKTDKGMDLLVENVRQLLEFQPHFITCTYGAGGSTRDRTLDTLAHVQALSDIPVASHLTCVNATVANRDGGRDRRIEVVPVRVDLVDGLARTLWKLLGAVSGVLLIAATNVANLLQARAQQQREE